MNAPNPEMNDHSKMEMGQPKGSSWLDAEFGPEEYFEVELRLHEIHSNRLECDFAEEVGMEVPVNTVPVPGFHGFPLKSTPPSWKNVQSEVNLLPSKERSRISNG